MSTWAILMSRLQKVRITGSSLSWRPDQDVDKFVAQCSWINCKRGPAINSWFPIALPAILAALMAVRIQMFRSAPRDQEPFIRGISDWREKKDAEIFESRVGTSNNCGNEKLRNAQLANRVELKNEKEECWGTRKFGNSPGITDRWSKRELEDHSQSASWKKKCSFWRLLDFKDWSLRTRMASEVLWVLVVSATIIPTDPTFISNGTKLWELFEAFQGVKAPFHPANRLEVEDKWKGCWTEDPE